MEMAYDEFSNDFDKVVQNANSILRIAPAGSQSSTSKVSHSVPSTDDLYDSSLRLTLTRISPLFPLYVVGHRCREPRLQRQALSLLQRSRWIDGLWNSRLTAAVCTRIIDLEERHARVLCHPNALIKMPVAFR